MENRNNVPNSAPNGSVPFGNAAAAAPVAPVSQNGKAEKSNVGYRVLAILLGLFAVGGLFLGMIGKAVPALAHARMLQAGTVAPGSFLAYIIYFFMDIGEIFKALFASVGGSPAEIFGLIGQLVLIETIIFIIIAVLISFILGIVGVCSRTASKGCMHAIAILILLSYGELFMFTFAINAPLVPTYKELFTTQMIDMPSLIMAGVALVTLLVTVLAEQKGRGVINVLLTLFSLGTVIAFFLPNSTFALYALMGLEYGEGRIFPLIAAIVVYLLIASNLLSTCTRVCAKRGFVGDIVRTLLMIIGIVLLVVASITEKFNLFDGGTSMIIGPVLVIAFAVLAFAMSIVATVVYAIAASKQKKEAELAAAQAALRSPRPNAPAGYRPPMNPNGQNSNEYYRPPVQPMQPAPPAQPMSPVAPNANAQPPQPRPQPQMTDFEKRMAELAAKDQPAKTPEPPTQFRPFATVPAAPAAQEKTDAFVPSKYSYDPFVSMLTTSEMNEFGDLFIANKFGLQSYIPQYIIGGDNKDFFNKVFIYLGRYRNNISDALLDKMYRYACAGQK